jgi:predicted transcriptional regulator
MRWRKHGDPTAKHKRGPPRSGLNTPRDLEMIAMYKAGDVLETIGARYGITRERVRQRLAAHGITKKDGGEAAQQRALAPIRAEAKRLKEEERAARCLKQHGMTLDEYRAHIAKYGNERTKGTPRYVFKNLRNTMRFGGVPWELSFADWWQIWQDSGKWGWHGRGRGYCLCRINCDLGFTKENVHIIRGDQRASESRNRYWERVRAAL